jgi:hypothetical protein
MPRGKTLDNYKDAKIYRLVATGTTDVYIGATCGTLEKRLYNHNFSVSNEKTKKNRACLLYNEGRTVAIELVEKFQCANKDELNVRERYWIENTPNCINKNKPGRTWQERWIDNPSYTEKRLAYRNKKYECECGAVISMSVVARHKESKKHVEALK